MPNKRGRLHATEEAFIRKHAQTLSPAQIAEQLSRTEATVKDYIVQHLGLPVGDTPEKVAGELVLQRELRNSPEWDILKDELTEDELKYFKHRYGKLMSQFKEDVLATEETQIFMLIRYEILMNRNMKDRKRSVIDIERLEHLIEDTYNEAGGSAGMDGPTKALVLNIENQLAAARAAVGNKSNEYVKLTEKHSSLMKELKGTREQRVQNKIEHSKMTMLDLIKLTQQEEFRKKEGRHMELVRLGAEKQAERLAEYHTYADSGIDQPLLSAETVEEE